MKKKVSANAKPGLVAPVAEPGDRAFDEVLSLIQSSKQRAQRGDTPSFCRMISIGEEDQESF